MKKQRGRNWQCKLGPVDFGAIRALREIGGESSDSETVRMCLRRFAINYDSLLPKVHLFAICLAGKLKPWCLRMYAEDLAAVASIQSRWQLRSKCAAVRFALRIGAWKTGYRGTGNGIPGMSER